MANKDAAHHKLAEEMMDLARMARGTEVLFKLIKKSPKFNLAALKRQMSAMSKEDRDALEIRQLMNIVTDLSEKNDILQNSLLELEKMIEEASDRIEEREAQIADLQEEIKKNTEANENKLADLENENAAMKLKISSHNVEIEDLERQKQINKQQANEISRLKEEIANAHVSQLEKSELAELKEQLDKLYWVNRELVDQIKERDNQTQRLQNNFKNLQEEDKCKSHHIDALDAMKREKELEKELLQKAQKEQDFIIEKYEKKLGESNKIINSLNDDIGRLKEQIHSMEMLSKEADGNNVRAEQEIQRLRSELNQNIEKQRLLLIAQIDTDKLRKKIHELEFSLEKETIARKGLNGNLQKLQKNINQTEEEYENEIHHLKQKNLLLLETISKRDSECSQLKDDISLQRKSFECQLTENPDVSILENRIKELEYYFYEYTKLTDGPMDKQLANEILGKLTPSSGKSFSLYSS